MRIKDLVTGEVRYTEKRVPPVETVDVPLRATAEAGISMPTADVEEQIKVHYYPAFDPAKHTRIVSTPTEEQQAKMYVEGQKMRTFISGATRDTDSGKHDYRGYLSPLVLKRFGEYMTKHRIQADGSTRESDNWKKGIPQNEYLSSALRHVVDVWLLHEGYNGVATQDIEEALCGLLFNVQGYLHSHLERSEWPTFTPTSPPSITDAGRDEVPF